MFLPTARYIRSNPCQITALPIVQPFSANFPSADTSVFRITTSLPQSLNAAPSGTRKCYLCRKIMTAEAVVSCSTCGSVVYCGEEHKELDWPRHKPSCSVPLKETLSTADQNSAPPTSIINGVDTSQPSTSTAFDINERLVATKDPDIQIIETGMSAKPAEANGRSRKRALQKNGRPYKDHSKNFLFKTTFQEHVKNLADRGLVVNQHQATAIRLKYIAEHVIRGLNEYGWAVVDNFLGKHHCNQTYTEVESLYNEGKFTAGQLMDGGKKDFNPSDIRSDKILWFGNDKSDDFVQRSVTIRLLIAMVDSVVVHFKKRIPPYEIAGRSKAMIAVYPGNGTRYVKHVDNPVRDGRCITTIYYCNENWELMDHGGTLRLYPETSEMPMDVDPQADRLIFFWSDKRIPHEVLPVYRHRYAITLWYFDVHERRKAMNERRKSATDSSSTAAAASNTATECSGNPNGNSVEVGNGAQAHVQASTTELGNGLSAVAARHAAGEALPPGAVSFAVPTRPAQRSPMKAAGSPATRTLSAENVIYKTNLAKLGSTKDFEATDGDTPFESLRNSQELSDFRRQLESCAGSQAGMPATDLDQQPLDLSKKPRINQPDQPMTMTFSSTFPSPQALNSSNVPLNANSLSSLEGVGRTGETKPMNGQPGQSPDNFNI